MFDSFFQKVIMIEGGYVDNPLDSGGKTKYGITEDVARANGYDGDMKDFPIVKAKEIYKKQYWDAMRLDDVAKHAPFVAVKLGDIAVNMGTGRAGVFLQRSLNALNDRQRHYADIATDGIVGKKTISALEEYIKKRKNNGELVLLRALNCLQGNFYIQLTERREKDEAFLYGWLLNRIQ